MTSEESNTNISHDMQSPNPRLPQLYFSDNKKRNSSEYRPTGLNIPPELLQHAVDFLDWGDLAKMSVVAREWSQIVNDAADFGGHDSKWELAVALLEGTNGLQRNPTRALALLKELAGIEIKDNNDNEEEGKVSESTAPFAPAMKLIADCYLTGNGIEKNNKTGIKWLEAAHNIGEDADSAHKLALMYEYGEYGTELDVYLAADWFLKAAVAGHIEAMAEYAMCCELGCGVDQSDENALEWYMKAANAGHVTSKYSVGEAFEEARGVPQSDEEACLWYYKAACEGDEDSKKALRRLHDIARIVVPGVGTILDV